MARLVLPMPSIHIPSAELKAFGAAWTENGSKLSRTPPHSSLQLGSLFDQAVGTALATMLGNAPTVPGRISTLQPDQTDKVEVGPVLVVGGVRPQNFDAGYRPDGVRFAFDSKTLNDTKSVRKNWQNMVNDLATEATTVHSRFPYAVVSFLVAIPIPCLPNAQREALVGTLERLTGRKAIDEPLHLAEALSLVLWDPATGELDPGVPAADSPLRLEAFSRQVESAYVDRYKGLPPHAIAEAPQQVDDE